MFVSALCLVVLLFGVPATAEEKAQDLQILAADNNEFALDLFREIVNVEETKSQRKNIFFSPYSVSSALAMTYAGAKGETAEQMEEALRFYLCPEKLHESFSEFDTMLDAVQEKGNVELSIANSIWPQEGFDLKDNYVKLLKRHYDISVTPVNYSSAVEAARRRINSWVEEKTKERIKDLIGKKVLTPLTRLVLVNAIYFKGVWLHPFEEENTREAPFYLNGGETVDVSIMYQEERLKYGVFEGIQALELPYDGENLSMMIMLPEKNGNVDELAKSLSTERFEKIERLMETRKVQVFLPRFELNWGTESLKDELIELGMAEPFEAGVADFSGIAGDPGDVNISDVLHKAFVKVNEEGTEAAAATAVIVVTRSATPEEVVVFRADRPFLFFIKDNNTGAILFAGQCRNPR